MLLRILLFMAVLGCFSCAAHLQKSQHPSKAGISGEVTSGVVDAPSWERYKAEAGAHYEQPTASPDNPVPTYPPALLSKRLSSISIQVRVVVNEMGQVTDVITSEQPNSDYLALVDNVRLTVQQWKFSPLVKIMPGDGTTTLRDVFGADTEYEGKATPLSFHQDYQFVFSQTEGKASVTVH